MAIRVSTYQNRKEQKKVQVTMDREEAEALVALDKETSKTLRAAVKEALAK